MQEFGLLAKHCNACDCLVGSIHPQATFQRNVLI